MKVRHAGFALCLLLGAALAAQAGKPPEWVEVHSAHFHVISDASPKKVQEMTQQLEHYRRLLAWVFPGLRLDGPLPTTVIFFKNDRSYRPYQPLTPGGKPLEAAGFMQPGQERMYLAVNLGAMESQETSFHEFIHLVVRLSFQQVPLWLDEGLAEFFERTQLTSKDFILGDFQPGWWELLQQNDLIPLGTLVEVDHRSDYYNVGQKRMVFYAESWALLHYLMAADEGKRQKQLDRFIQLLRQETPQESAFQQAFGADYAGMHRQLRDYLLRHTLSRYEGAMPPAEEMKPLETASLPTPVAQAYLSDLWLNSGRIQEAEKALAQLAQDPAAPPEVRYRLGRIALLQGRMEEAEKQFEAALAARPDDLGLRYYAAWAVSQGRLATAAGFEERRAAATRVIELLSPVLAAAKEFPDAFALLVHAHMARNDSPAEMIPLLEQARRLMPQRHDFNLLLASLYLRERRWDEAEALLQQVAHQAASDTERRQAEEWLEQVRAERARPAGEREGPVLIEAAPAESKPAPAREPEEPPPAAVPTPAKVSYVRGTLVTVACSDDTALLTVKEEPKKSGEEKVIHLAVRSRARLILLDPTESGRKLDCGLAGVLVGINYRVEPQGDGIAGVVMTVEFQPPAR